MIGNLVEVYVDLTILVVSIPKLSISDAIYQLIVTLTRIFCNCALSMFELTRLPICLSIVASIEKTFTKHVQEIV